MARNLRNITALKRAMSGSDVTLQPGQTLPATKRGRKSNRTPAELEKLSAQRLINVNKFLDHWKHACGPDVLLTEYIFDPVRDWRMDFAIPQIKVMIELDGGTWSRGKSGHNSGTGIRRDHEKQNAAVMAGWRPFRFTSDMLSKKEGPVHVGALVAFVNKELLRYQKYTKT